MTEEWPTDVQNFHDPPVPPVIKRPEQAGEANGEGRIAGKCLGALLLRTEDMDIAAH